MTNNPHSSPQKTHAQLLEQIESLTDAVQRLRAQKERLEAERDQLQEENRTLRRDLTHSRLINEIEQSIADADDQEKSSRSVPPIADRLYQALPPSFSFPAYFQVAESEGMEMDTARRCLRHFLAKGYVARAGSRLQKEDHPPPERMRGGDGRSVSLSP